VTPVFARPLRSLQRNILAGIITIGPLFVTYLIFSFLLGTLAKAGLPVVQLFATIFPERWLGEPWLQPVLAVVLTLAVLWIVGRVTSLVIGRQAFELFEAVLERLPPEQRVALKLFYADGYNYNEIARFLGCPEKRVKSHLQNGRKCFRSIWEKTEGGAR